MTLYKRGKVLSLAVQFPVQIRRLSWSERSHIGNLILLTNKTMFRGESSFSAWGSAHESAAYKRSTGQCPYLMTLARTMLSYAARVILMTRGHVAGEAKSLDATVCLRKCVLRPCDKVCRIAARSLHSTWQQLPSNVRLHRSSIMIGHTWTHFILFEGRWKYRILGPVDLRKGLPASRSKS